MELLRLQWTSVWELERTFSLQNLFPDFGFLISKQKSSGHKEHGPRSLRKYFAVVGWKCDDGKVVAHFKRSNENTAGGTMRRLNDERYRLLA